MKTLVERLPTDHLIDSLETTAALRALCKTLRDELRATTGEGEWVPKDVWDWLMGANGEFECPDPDYYSGHPPKYWWRRELRRRIAAAPPPPLRDAGAVACPQGWRVIPFSGSFKRDDERWEIYGPDGGGAINASDVHDPVVAKLLDALAAHPAPPPPLRDALKESEVIEASEFALATPDGETSTPLEIGMYVSKPGAGFKVTFAPLRDSGAVADDGEKSPGLDPAPPSTPAQHWLATRNATATQEWQDGFNTCAARTPPAPAQVDEANELLRSWGLDPNRFRSEGGFLNPGKIRAALLHPEEYPHAAAAKKGNHG